MAGINGISRIRSILTGEGVVPFVLNGRSSWDIDYGFTERLRGTLIQWITMVSRGGVQ